MPTTPPPVPPPTQPTVYVNFTGQITQAVASKFMAACAEIMARDNPSCLYFLFSSPGGDVNSGVAIYNYLRALPVSRMVMHNTGSIDSVANVIFHAADERLAAPHTTFHFHGVSLNLPGTNPSLNHSRRITAGPLSPRKIRRYRFRASKGCHPVGRPSHNPQQYEVL